MEQAPPQPAKRKSRLRALGSLVALALLIWLLSRQNWGQIVSTVRTIPLWSIAASAALFVSGICANAIRWRLLLRSQAIAIGLGETLRMSFAASFASNFLPSTVGGDALRVLSLSRFTPNRALAVGSVLADRLLNVAAMATVLPFSWQVFGSPLGLLSTSAGPALAGLWLPARLRQKLAHQLGQLAAVFKIWSRQPLVLARAFVVSWLSVLVIFLAVWVLTLGMNLPIQLHQVMGVSAITYFLTLLPISINGYGVREVTFITLYVQLGLTSEQATSLALLTRLLMVLETLPGGLWLPGLVGPGGSRQAEGGHD